MDGRRPRSGRRPARSGPASSARWARPATTRPPRPRGDPGPPGSPGTPGSPEPSGPPGTPGGPAPSGSLGTPGAFASSGRPGDPAGQDIVDRGDILDRAPGRWSPSRLGTPPRWLLAVIAVLVLAGGVTAFVAGGLGHGQAHPSRANAQVAVLPTACTYLIGPINPAALAHGRHEPRQDAGCARPGPAEAGVGVGGIGPGSSSVCVALQVQDRHPASQFGIRHRCYPGLT